MCENVRKEKMQKTGDKTWFLYRVAVPIIYAGGLCPSNQGWKKPVFKKKTKPMFFFEFFSVSRILLGASRL
jgi:hypothetical protein